MATGNVETWTGAITDIGAIYPFVGSEMALFVIGVALWIAWFVLQARMEDREYQDELEQSTREDPK